VILLQGVSKKGESLNENGKGLKGRRVMREKALLRIETETPYKKKVSNFKGQERRKAWGGSRGGALALPLKWLKPPGQCRDKKMGDM